MAIKKITFDPTSGVPSLYSTKVSDKVTLAGGWIVNGFGKLVDGVELTCALLAQV